MCATVLNFFSTSGSTAEGGGGSGAIVLQEARMNVLSDQECTDGWGSDIVPNNLDICVRDDDFGGDTQICYVCTFSGI